MVKDASLLGQTFLMGYYCTKPYFMEQVLQQQQEYCTLKRISVNIKNINAFGFKSGLSLTKRHFKSHIALTNFLFAGWVEP